MILSSSRASEAPRQKWGPNPNARCGFGSGPGPPVTVDGPRGDAQGGLAAKEVRLVPLVRLVP